MALTVTPARPAAPSVVTTGTVQAAPAHAAEEGLTEHGGYSPSFLAACGPPEDDTGGEVVAEVGEGVLGARLDEDGVARLERAPLASLDEAGRCL